jgi:formylglycine-generating enzyme required for sulfatase activity
MRSERLLAMAITGCVLLGLACGSGGNGGPTAPAEPPPRAPSDLQIGSTSAEKIVILWRDRSSDETGFQIERSTGGTASFAKLDTVRANNTTYEDAISIEAGQTYYYRVRSYVHSSFSDPSPSVWAIAVANQSPAAPVPVNPINGARDLEAGTVTLQWSASDPDAGDQLLFEVFAGTVRNELEKVADGVTETQITLPNPVVLNAHYFWQVKARDPKGAMGVSPIWGFNTRIERVTYPAGWLVMGDDVEFVHPGDPISVGSFEIDKYEVTNQQFADFLNEAIRVKDPGPMIRTSGGGVYDGGGVILYAATNEGKSTSQITYDLADSLFSVISGKENFPAIEVTWDGANAFAQYYDRRLPTEAEWEMAARGNSNEYGERTFTVEIDGEPQSVTVGLGRTFPWGQQADGSRANFDGSSDPFESQARVRTTPVGFYDGLSHGGFQTQDGSTALGVHDMAGNVSEWCEDWYGPYTNPHNPPETGILKIVRGGNWNKGPGSMQTWRRDHVRPEVADFSVGFRTVATVR